MNCPSRVDSDDGTKGWNQNPPDLAADLTTRGDLGKLANSRTRSDHRSQGAEDAGLEVLNSNVGGVETAKESSATKKETTSEKHNAAEADVTVTAGIEETSAATGGEDGTGKDSLYKKIVQRFNKTLYQYAKFIGPGFMIAVAYIDPGRAAHGIEWIKTGI
jgi:metal iron transporter